AGPSAVHRIAPGPGRILPVCTTFTSYGQSIDSMRIVSVSTAGPIVVTASIVLPTPPSPLAILTLVNGIHSLWRSHAVRARNTRSAGAFTITVAVTSVVD